MDIKTVDICVITFCRPDSLSQLMIGLEALDFSKVVKPDLRIVLVDNDPEGSAESIYLHHVGQSKWPIHYAVEKNRGIPQARNRAIKETRNGVDFVAFIDDDELPDPYWMDELLHMQELNNAHIVYGPVISRFSEVPPQWATRGNWFSRKRHQDGSRIGYAATNNVLIHKKVFSSLDAHEPFNVEMALTGGSDTYFFALVKMAGYEIVWADHALVYEWLPRSRVTLRWVLMRAFRTGYTELFLDMISLSPCKARVTRLLRGLIRLVGGGFLLFSYLFLSIFKGAHCLIVPARIVFRGAGMISSVIGIRYEEYKKIHRI